MFILTAAGRAKVYSVDDVLAILSSGFLRGPGRFHKGASASNMIKGTGTVSREVRAGMSYVSSTHFFIIFTWYAFTPLCCLKRLLEVFNVKYGMSALSGEGGSSVV